MNLQSRVIRIPICTAHHWKQLTLFGQPSPCSENLYRPASIKETDWIEHPTHPPPPPPLLLSLSLSSDYFLSATPSLFVFDLELLALLAMGVQCLCDTEDVWSHFFVFIYLFDFCNALTSEINSIIS